MEITPVTNSKIIGTAPDHSPLRSWSEGERTFMETWTTFTATSGTAYGLVVVVETTTA